MTTFGLLTWLILFLYISPVPAASGRGKTDLHLGGLLTLGSEPDFSGVLPGIELALEHINDDQEILADYELKLKWENTRVCNYEKEINIYV